MISKIQTLKRLIGQLDFDGLWPGFRPTAFAIYNGDRVLTSSVDMEGFQETVPDERFAGNTVIHWDDGWLAIWDDRTTPPNMSDAELAASIVHEMFHCFQHEYGEKRFPDELLGAMYPMTEENLFLRMEERRVLLLAQKSLYKQEQLTRLAWFYGIRKRREQLIGEAIWYEKAVESTEGTAVYVEDESYRELEPEHDVFANWEQTFTALNDENLCIRLSSYAQWLVLARIADRLMPGWQSRFMDSGKWLSDFILDELEILPDKAQDIGRASEEIRQWVGAWKQNRDRAFEEFREGCPNRHLDSGFSITGIDPMNLIVRDNEVLHKNFIRIRTDDGERLIQGPVKAVIVNHLFDVSKIEWKQ